MPKIAGHLGIAILAVALFALPFHSALSGATPALIYNALAADTYYYTALARNFTLHGFFGVDGETVSSGYMPLWQLIVAGLDRVFAGPQTDPQVLLGWVFNASVLLAALGVAGLALFVTRRYGQGYGLVTLPLICPGAAFFLIDRGSDQTVGLHSGTGMWSFANGMESGIGLFLFALFVPFAAACLDEATVTRRKVLWAGALAFLIFMARLDDVFVGLAFGVCLLPLALRLQDTRLLVAAALVPLIGTALYLGLNTVMTGAALPSSGMLKTRVFDFPTGWTELASLGSGDRTDLRLSPLLAALLAGVLGLLSQTVKSLRSDDAPLIAMLSLYLIMKSGFLFSSVAVYEQGYWYYTNLLAAVNLLIVIGLARAWRLSRPGMAIATTASLAVAVVAGMSAQAKLRHFPADSYATVARDLCSDPAPVTALLPQGARIIDTGDGFYAFCTGRPAVTLTGLSDSLEFIEKRNQLGFFAAALLEQHDYLLASPVEFASYNWQGQLAPDHTAIAVGQVGQVSVWRIEPKE